MNIDEAIRLFTEKYRRSAAKAKAQDIIPYYGSGTSWQAGPNGDNWWTGGFWPALMWILYKQTKDELFLQEARRVEKRLQAELMRFEGLSHDVGFMYLLGAGADYKLTGDETAQRDTQHAAAVLMGRYNPAGYLRAWNPKEKLGYAIIDSLMNLPLLYRVQRETGDPRFGNLAEAWADRVQQEFVRADGSVKHIVEFDPTDGSVIREIGGQGYAEGTSWSRGQSWALYGFTLMYINSKKEKYLETAQQVAAYFIQNIREDGLTDCDFRQPKSPKCIDNIAGMCAACALIELSRITHNAEYMTAALRLVNGALERCCDFSENSLGVLTHCTAAYHAKQTDVHTNLMYGDYFLAEALAKLSNTDPMLWY